MKLLVGLLYAVEGAYHISGDSSAIIDGLPRLGSDLDLYVPLLQMADF
jgi:hypothetical protein